jgi:hypothetical protein
MVQSTIFYASPGYWGAPDLSQSFLRFLGEKADVIVLDAFDGEGKSTTAKLLAQLTGYEVIHYPLNHNGYQDADGYISEMIQTMEQLSGKIIDRFVYSTIAYNSIQGREFQIARLMNFVRQNGILITSIGYWQLLTYKLRNHKDLLDILTNTRVLIFYPYIRFKPNWDDTLAHMHDSESINFVKTQLMTLGMYQ